MTATNGDKFYIRKRVERDTGSGQFFVFVTLYKKGRFFRKKVKQLSDTFYWNEYHRLTPRMEDMVQQLREEVRELNEAGAVQRLREQSLMSRS